MFDEKRKDYDRYFEIKIIIENIESCFQSCADESRFFETKIGVAVATREKNKRNRFVFELVDNGPVHTFDEIKAAGDKERAFIALKEYLNQLLCEALSKVDKLCSINKYLLKKEIETLLPELNVQHDAPALNADLVYHEER